MPRLFLNPARAARPLLPERSRDLRQVQGQGGGLPHLQDSHGQLRLTGQKIGARHGSLKEECSGVSTGMPSVFLMCTGTGSRYHTYRYYVLSRIPDPDPDFVQTL
jgi:hypothetical protein